MPFTASHAAAVLPFAGTGLPASALVIGSMTPDLPYFLPVRLGQVYPPWTVGGPSHTVWALVTLDLLIGVVAWLVWHGLLAEPLLAMAPGPVRARLVGRVDFGVGRRLGRGDRAGVALGIVVGAASHVLWDEFTHDGRWGVRHLPPLAETWAGRPGFSWAQGASDLVGALVLAVWLSRWWRSTPVRPVVRGRASWLVWPAIAGAGVLAGALVVVLVGFGPGMGFLAAVWAGAGVLVAATTASLLWRVLPIVRPPLRAMTPSRGTESDHGPDRSRVTVRRGGSG